MVGWGDFNIFLTMDERSENAVDQKLKMVHFAYVIFYCHVIDPNFEGLLFTWDRENPPLLEKLDRVLLGEFSTRVLAVTRVSLLAGMLSDHSPLLIQCQFLV